MNKRMFIKTLSVFIAVVMLLALMPTGIITSAATTASGWCGDNVKWSLSNGVLTLSGSGYMWDYGIDSNSGNVPITSAPWGMMIFSKIVIGNGIYDIGAYAFTGCYDATSVSIPGSVGMIGEGAFGYCYGLTSAGIPNSVWYIGDYAFYNCWSLTAIVIPNSVETIGNYAFEFCESADTIVIGSGVTSIGADAFWDCDPSVFNVDVNNPVYYSAGNCLIERKTARIVRGSSTSVIPAGIRIIGDGAFGYCLGMKSMVIPEGVTTIEDYAFYGNYQMESINIAASVTSIGEHAFLANDNVAWVYIPAEFRVYRGSYAHDYCRTFIGSYVFLGSLSGQCGNHLTWTLNDGALMISGYGDMANYDDYDYCYRSHAPWEVGVKSVTIGSGLTSIGNRAFFGCRFLTSLSIPDSVTRIGEYAFEKCSNLTSISMPKELRSIGDCAFRYCSNLTNIVIPNSVTSIGRYAFDECSALTDVTIPDSVTEIYDGAFNYCTGLTSVMIPDSVTYIGEYVFRGCTDLTIQVYKNSYAHRYAVNNGLDYVLVKKLERISVTTLPAKTSYKEGEALDVNGGRITLYYNDDSSETVNVTADMVSGFDSTRTGIQTLTVTYGGMTATFNVTVVELLRIAVTTLPAKTTYFKYKEALDVTGGRITLYYDNGTSEVIDMTADMVSGFDNTKAGSQTLTVTYGDRTASFNVNVVEKTLERIAVTALPDKTIYQKGEALDVTGGKITMYYSDGSSGTLAMTASMVSGFDNTKIGEQTLRVTFGGKATVFTVTVVKPAAAMGDPDGDGEITVADALAALRIAAKLAEPTPELLAACDTDGDGEITVADALAILRVAAKLADSF